MADCNGCTLFGGMLVSQTNEQLYSGIVDALEKQPLLQNGTREILNFYAPFNPNQRLSRCKESYLKAEIDWYRTHDLCIRGHDKIDGNKIWDAIATEDGYVNSNYGWCIFDEENHKQYKHAVDALLKDPHTRQSCCIYTRPSIQKEWNDGIHADHDFICTFATHHFIRNNKLEYIVYMRSNDVEFGLPYDLAWHQYVYKNMYNDLVIAGELSETPTYKYLDVGSIHWHASSLHKYENR